MSTPTLLLDGRELAGESAEVDGDAYRHFFRARRLAVGDPVRVVNGRGAARWGEVLEVTRDVARLALGEAAPSGEPSLRLTVAAAAIRPERAATLVEKTTEIGVARVLWFRAERSQHAPGERVLERLRRVARAAVEQSGRSCVPTIEALDLETLLDEVRRAQAVLLDVEQDATVPPLERVLRLGLDAPESARAQAPRLLVGPEGGFTTTERRQFLEAGAQPLRLGHRILRAETAAIVGSALLLAAASE